MRKTEATGQADLSYTSFSSVPTPSKPISVSQSSSYSKSPSLAFVANFFYKAISKISKMELQVYFGTKKNWNPCICRSPQKLHWKYLFWKKSRAFKKNFVWKWTHPFTPFSMNFLKQFVQTPCTSSKILFL